MSAERPQLPSLDALTQTLVTGEKQKLEAAAREKKETPAQIEAFLGALEAEFSEATIDTEFLTGMFGIDNMASVLGKKTSEEMLSSVEGTTVQTGIEQLKQLEAELEQNMNQLRSVVTAGTGATELTVQEIDSAVEALLNDEGNDLAQQVKAAREQRAAVVTQLQTALREFGLSMIHTLQENNRLKKKKTEEEFLEWETRFAQIDAPPQDYETRVADARERFAARVTKDIQREISQLQNSLSTAKQNLESVRTSQMPNRDTVIYNSERYISETEQTIEALQRSLAAQEVLQEQLFDTIQRQIETDITDEYEREAALQQILSSARILNDWDGKQVLIKDPGTTRFLTPTVYTETERERNFGFNPNHAVMLERPNGVSDESVAAIVEEMIRTQVLSQAATLYEGTDIRGFEAATEDVGMYNLTAIQNPSSWKTYEAKLIQENTGFSDSPTREYMFVPGMFNTADSRNTEAVLDNWGDVLQDALAVQQFVLQSDPDLQRSGFFGNDGSVRQKMENLQYRTSKKADIARRTDLVQAFSQRANTDLPRGERKPLTTKDHASRNRDTVAAAEQTALGAIAERDAAIERATAAEIKVKALEAQIVQLNASTSRMDAVTADYNDRVQNLDGTVANLRSRLNQSEQEIARTRQEMNATLQRLRAIADDARTSPGALGGNAKKALDEIAALLRGM